METKRYLGNSVYVEFDGYSYVLTTDPNNTIVLYPETVVLRRIQVNPDGIPDDVITEDAKDVLIKTIKPKEQTMNRIVQVLMDRDGLTEEDAKEQVAEMMEDFHERLAEGEDPSDICEEYFGLEPDYLEELI